MQDEWNGIKILKKYPSSQSRDHIQKKEHGDRSQLKQILLQQDSDLYRYVAFNPLMLEENQ